MQKLEVTIPDSYVIITREEHQSLLDSQDERVWIGLKDLMEMVNLSRDKLTDILYRYREELDVYEGGPVKYPDGGKWSFEKEGSKKWLKENHSRIWSDDLQRV